MWRDTSTGGLEGRSRCGQLGQLELRFNNKVVELDAQGIVTVRELAKATAATINARTPQYFPLINLDPIPFRKVRIMVGKLRAEGRQHLSAKYASALFSSASSATRRASFRIDAMLFLFVTQRASFTSVLESALLDGLGLQHITVIWPGGNSPSHMADFAPSNTIYHETVGILFTRLFPTIFA